MEQSIEVLQNDNAKELHQLRELNPNRLHVS